MTEQKAKKKASVVPYVEWVDRIYDDEFDDRTLVDKIKTGANAYPFIPLGVLATCAALGFGLRAFKHGDSFKQNKFMFLRVYAQAFTIGLVSFSVFRSKGKKEENKEKSVTE